MKKMTHSKFFNLLAEKKDAMIVNAIKLALAYKRFIRSVGVYALKPSGTRFS